VIPKRATSPRYEWRGVMLDVARHFFSVDDVKRFVDVTARYGLNRLHLHLTDDQGWRIEIESWPRLAEVGGATAVGGGRGGWYTQEEYAEIVAFAAKRDVVVVPEIDLPGHVNAALVAYPELAPAGYSPAPYTGTDVGFSSLDLTSEATYEFVDDVVREVAALTPGPYFHIGGDEAEATAPADYVRFVERLGEVVQRQGKRLVGWEEVAQAKLPPGAIVQHWKDSELAERAVEQGASLIMSPASRTYLDMKYDRSTGLGSEWAGYVGVRHAYEWDPGDVLGVEAAVWTETLETFADVEFMAFPRLLALAEIAWSPTEQRDWQDFRTRVAEHEPQLAALGVNFFRSPEIPWHDTPRGIGR
jgi:hexosaminidase